MAKTKECVSNETEWLLKPFRNDVTLSLAKRT